MKTNIMLNGKTKAAADGESYEWQEMYPSFAKKARELLILSIIGLGCKSDLSVYTPV